MQWGGGGGGCAAAVGNAAAAIAGGWPTAWWSSGRWRRAQHGRFGQARPAATAGAEMAYMAPYGVLSPAQKYAMKVQRFMHEHGVRQEALRAVALASYHHAQRQPARGDARQAAGRSALRRVALDRRALPPVRRVHGKRRCRGDRAGQAERARDLQQQAGLLLGVAVGSDHRTFASAHNQPHYASASFVNVAQDLYRMAGVGPADVGSVQAYENFTGGVVMALAEHGFFAPAEANDFMTPTTSAHPAAACR
jgi:hypothetical protein